MTPIQPMDDVEAETFRGGGWRKLRSSLGYSLGIRSPWAMWYVDDLGEMDLPGDADMKSRNMGFTVYGEGVADRPGRSGREVVARVERAAAWAGWDVKVVWRHGAPSD